VQLIRPPIRIVPVGEFFRKVDRPVLLGRDLGVHHLKPTTRFQLENPLKRRLGRRCGPPGEDLIEPLKVNPPGYLRITEDGLDFGCKAEGPLVDRVEERSYAHPITGSEQPATVPIIDSKRKLAIETLQTIVPPLFVGMNDDLSVGLGANGVASFNQLPPQLNVIEYLTVEGDPDGSVFVGQRL